MVRFLIDVNLPYRFALWHRPDVVHQFDLGQTWSDTAIWAYARQHQLTVVTKDRDFAERLLREGPPPRIIWLRLGNLSSRSLYELLTPRWPDIERLNAVHQLVQVFPDRLEGTN